MKIIIEGEKRSIFMKKFMKNVTTYVVGAAIIVTSFLTSLDYVGWKNEGISEVEAATTSTTPEEIQDAIKQLCIKMHKNHEYGYHYVRNWNIKFADYYSIWDATEKNEVAYEVSLNQNTLIQTVKDSDGYVEYIYEHSEDQFMDERVKAYERERAYCHEQLKGMSDLDKLIWLNEYLVDNVYYYNDESDITTHHFTSAFGYGYGVCSSYAEAIEKLLDQEGIGYEEVFSSNHVWIGVFIDGKEYHYDPTWDDTRGARHRYLLRNDEEWGKAPCTHEKWYRIKDDGLGTKIYTPVSTDTSFTDWYVHDVSGRMLYYEGKWYYASGNNIYKNDAYGTCEETVYEGISQSTLIGISNDVLTYSQGGKVKTIVLKETEANKAVSTCDHENIELKKAKSATCKFAGYTGDKYCKDCKIKLGNGTQIKVGEHTYGEEVVEKLATKKEGGYNFKTCSTCGFRSKIYTSRLTDSDAAEGKCIHENFKIEGKVTPTCEKDGFSGDKICADCGTLIIAGQEVKCTGHIWKSADGEEKCMLCGETKEKESTTTENITSESVSTETEKETEKEAEPTTEQQLKISKVNNFKVEKNASNSVKLTWKKNTRASGYEIGIYTNKKWSKLKNVSSKTTTLNVTKLKAATPYKFRIMGYIKNDSTTKYSAYTYCNTTTLPAKMNTPKVVRSGNKVWIRWKRVKCGGYQIVYSKTKNSRKVTRVNISSSRKTSYKTGRLKKGNTYYVKIRAYVVINGKKVYGKYSGVRRFIFPVTFTYGGNSV